MLWSGAGQRDTSSDHSVLQPSMSTSQHSLTCAQALVGLSFSGPGRSQTPCCHFGMSCCHWYVSPP